MPGNPAAPDFDSKRVPPWPFGRVFTFATMRIAGDGSERLTRQAMSPRMLRFLSRRTSDDMAFRKLNQCRVGVAC